MKCKHSYSIPLIIFWWNVFRSKDVVAKACAACGWNSVNDKCIFNRWCTEELFCILFCCMFCFLLCFLFCFAFCFVFLFCFHKSRLMHWGAFLFLFSKELFSVRPWANFQVVVFLLMLISFKIIKMRLKKIKQVFS